MNNVLNIMKSRVLLYCTLLVIVCSCTKTVRQSEDFDIVETNEYVNIYNFKGKLDSVKITQKQLMYESNVLTSVNIYTGLHTYTFQNNSLYSITETSEPRRNIIRATYYKDKTEKNYFFDTIPDKKDLRSIPKSKNKQFIKYHTYNTINNTLIEKTDK